MILAEAIEEALRISFFHDDYRRCIAFISEKKSNSDYVRDMVLSYIQATPKWIIPHGFVLKESRSKIELFNGNTIWFLTNRDNDLRGRRFTSAFVEYQLSCDPELSSKLSPIGKTDIKAFSW